MLVDVEALELLVGVDPQADGGLDARKMMPIATAVNAAMLTTPISWETS